MFTGWVHEIKYDTILIEDFSPFSICNQSVPPGFHDFAIGGNWDKSNKLHNIQSSLQLLRITADCLRIGPRRVMWRHNSPNSAKALFDMCWTWGQLSFKMISDPCINCVFTGSSLKKESCACHLNSFPEEKQFLASTITEKKFCEILDALISTSICDTYSQFSLYFRTWVSPMAMQWTRPARALHPLC